MVEIQQRQVAAFVQSLKLIQGSGGTEDAVVFRLKGAGWMDPHPNNLPEQATQVIHCIESLSGGGSPQTLFKAEAVELCVNAVKAWHVQARAVKLVESFLATDQRDTAWRPAALSVKDARDELWRNAVERIEKLIPLLEPYATP